MLQEVAPKVDLVLLKEESIRNAMLGSTNEKDESSKKVDAERASGSGVSGCSPDLSRRW